MKHRGAPRTWRPSKRDAAAATEVLNQDLSRRVERLLRGEGRSDDLDRLFLALRDRAGARASVREIGDFVAHRDQREKGLVTQKARDVFTSFQSWVRISVLGEPFTLADIKQVAEANLRNATSAQLDQRLGLKRQVARSVLAQALKKAKEGKAPTPRERRTIDYLGSAFIWNPAFTDTEVIADLRLVLEDIGLLLKAEGDEFLKCSAFITLHIIALMHGSAVLLDNGDRADLVAGFANKQARLEVKARLIVHSSKPIIAPTCLFWTSLLGPEHCAPALLAEPKLWRGPLEVDADGKLGPLGQTPPID